MHIHRLRQCRYLSVICSLTGAISRSNQCSTTGVTELISRYLPNTPAWTQTMWPRWTKCARPQTASVQVSVCHSFTYRGYFSFQPVLHNWYNRADITVPSKHTGVETDDVAEVDKVCTSTDCVSAGICLSLTHIQGLFLVPTSAPQLV